MVVVEVVDCGGGGCGGLGDEFMISSAWLGFAFLLPNNRQYELWLSLGERLAQLSGWLGWVIHVVSRLRTVQLIVWFQFLVSAIFVYGLYP